MLELQNFLKMKDFFAENFGNFWKKVVLRKISGTFVFEKITLQRWFLKLVRRFNSEDALSDIKHSCVISDKALSLARAYNEKQ
jgi:hypothetical protein